MQKHRKQFHQYSGYLSDEEIALGINFARKNAKRLYEDASYLVNDSRFASASALSILSIEESGKCIILKNIATSSSDDLKKFWKEYRSHTQKNAMWIFGSLVASGAKTLPDFSRMFDRNSDHSDILETYKQFALYTDCISDRKWISPESSIKPNTASELVKLAGQLLVDREITVREIELWRKFFKPGQTTAQMADAFIEWHAAMKSEGLTEVDTNAVNDFMGDFRGSRRSL